MEKKLEELATKLGQLEALLKDKEAALATALESVARLETENKKLVEDLAKIDKELTIEKANAKAEANKTQAESAIVTVFGESTLDEKFHSKITKLVPFEQYIKDGELDAVAFSDALRLEVKDWEDKILATAGAGLGSGEEKKVETGVTDFETAKAGWDADLGRKKKEG